MSSNRLNIQIATIFAIIILAFSGSAMFFSYLNTDSVRQAVETETRLSSVILSSTIRSSIPEALARNGYRNNRSGKDPASERSAGAGSSSTETARAESSPGKAGEDSYALDSALAQRLTNVISRANYEVGENVDVWVADNDYHILYENVTEGGGRLKELLSDDEWREMLSDIDAQKDQAEQSSLLWLGSKKRFRMSQQLLMVRPVFEGSLYLVICNRGTSVLAMQRRQFTLFASIEITLMIAMLVVLANTLFSYRKQLVRLATTDELTGLSNRKSFNEAYGDYIRDTNRGGTDVFSVFLIDIDYFKQINDTYGHAAGDQALRTLADHIHDMTGRYKGFAGRWGGDEFIGVLPATGEDTRTALQGMLEELRNVRLEGGFGVTISAGAAQVEPSGSRELAHLTEMADLALYASKEHGRDQATLYTKEMEAVSADAPPERNPAKDRAGYAPAAPAPADTAKDARKPAPKQASQRADAPLSLRSRMRVFIRERLLESILLGVKWMAPFVAGGGLLIGLAFLFDAGSIDLSSLSVSERTQLGSITPLAASLKSIGDSTFNFMLPVFAGFMAYGLAGESAFLAGFVGGFMTIQSNAGFIGAMIAGLVAGLIASEINQFIGRTPRFIQKAAPIVIFPVFNLLLMQVIASLIITPAASSLGHVFTQLLDYASATNSSLAGLAAGGMMAIDMGGIINKVAYNYGVSGLASGGTGFMASVMAGGMVPPIGIAISMVLFRHKYTEEEKDRLAGTLFMGLSFITEGALPFVFSDVLRVIPSCIAGSALAGMLSAVFGCRLPAPHGGVFVLPVMTHPLLYLAALLCGSTLTAVILGSWKKRAG